MLGANRTTKQQKRAQWRGKDGWKEERMTYESQSKGEVRVKCGVESGTEKEG